MNIIKELENQYNEIDKNFASKEFEARSRKLLRLEMKWKRKRELNSLAYFLFLFTRLEDQVRVSSSKLIQNKQTNLSSWKNRSVWDILPSESDSDKIYFLNRVALLTDKSKHNYAKIKEFYAQRNNIGHGGTDSINMIAIFPTMQSLYKLLKARS